jgi:hypothetical protein
MKPLFLFLLSLFSTKIYAQDSLRIDQVNTLVSIITHSKLPTQQDSMMQDFPGIGLSMKTYITLITFGKELKKYSQIVKSTRKEDQTIKNEIDGSAFYYDQNKLIKVEEFQVQDGKENKVEWYFSDDKCFYHTLKSAKAEERISLLLNLSTAFLKKFTGQ